MVPGSLWRPGPARCARLRDDDAVTLSGPLRLPAVRHGLLLTAAVLLVCTAVATLSWASLQRAQAQLDGLTARATGRIVAVGADVRPDVVRVRWEPPGRPARISEIALDGIRPAPGTRTEIAYDPSDPARATLPGSAVIATANRALIDLGCVAVVALSVLALGGLRILAGVRATRGQRRVLRARRVRYQSGLLSRSWLETEDPPRCWIPVYFDPALVTLPAPAEVTLRGSGRRIAALLGDRIVPASGRVHTTEPRGRRIDNPARPDADTARRAREATLRRHLRVDLALTIPAPFVGLFWAYLDGGGVGSWAGATTVAAAVGMWTGAYRGSDPT